MKQEDIERIKNWCEDNTTVGLINVNSLNEFLDNFNDDVLFEKTKILVDTGEQKVLN